MAEGARDGGGPLSVLMVAEKPSIAKALAGALGGGRARERIGVAPRSPVHEFWGTFQGEEAHFKVTATQGHVYSFDFGEEYNDWTKHGPEELFAAPIVRTFEGSLRLPEHLANEAQGCHALVLWLDCDREGENICFEVMQNVLPSLDASKKFRGAYRDRVFRARFSSLRPADLRSAMETLSIPNENEAQSVDARAEIDLRLGVAFSRFQTQYFKRHFSAQLGSVVKTVSYGPCQMPTLWFCVHRRCQLQQFEPKTYWTLAVTLTRQGDRFVAEGACGKMWERPEAEALLARVRPATEAKVTAMARRSLVRPRPLPLNTVAMLQKASERAGISPGDAMHCAEQLYLKGILSYPRTETSRYPTGFDVLAVVKLLQVPGAPWEEAADRLATERTAARTDGADVGDHPPITPVRYATESQCGDSGSWALYRLVCEHFLASISPDCPLDATEVRLEVVGVEIVAKSSRRKSSAPTWLEVVREPLKEEGDADLSWLPNGATCCVAAVEMRQDSTKPPEHLTESELLGLMERHGVGTDASMATHIANIQKRGYVRLDASTRQLLPEPMGLALAYAYTLVDPELVRPTVRASIENACARVAKGEAKKKEVVSKALAVFERKFKRFSRRVDKIPEMLAVAYALERSGGKDDGEREYTEEDWKKWAAKKKQENPEMSFSEEEWLEWLKQREASRRKDRPADGAGASGAAPAASNSHWDLAAKATAAISLEDLLRDRGSAEIGQEEPDDRTGLRPGATVSIHSLKGAAQLNGQFGTCGSQDAGTGRWHIKLASGEVKALKAENLTEIRTTLRPGSVVTIHGLKAAPELNGQEGICEAWDLSKGRWTIRLPSGEAKALKPDNLQENEDTDESAAQAVSRVQRELETLGFGRGMTSNAPYGGTPRRGGRRGDCGDDEEWRQRGQRGQWGQQRDWGQREQWQQRERGQHEQWGQQRSWQGDSGAASSSPRGGPQAWPGAGPPPISPRCGPQAAPQTVPPPPRAGQPPSMAPPGWQQPPAVQQPLGWQQTPAAAPPGFAAPAAGAQPQPPFTQPGVSQQPPAAQQGYAAAQQGYAAAQHGYVAAPPGYAAPPVAQPGYAAPPAAQPGYAPPAAQPGYAAPPAAQPPATQPPGFQQPAPGVAPPAAQPQPPPPPPPAEEEAGSARGERGREDRDRDRRGDRDRGRGDRGDRRDSDRRDSDRRDSDRRDGDRRGGDRREDRGDRRDSDRRDGARGDDGRRKEDDGRRERREDDRRARRREDSREREDRKRRRSGSRDRRGRREERPERRAEEAPRDQERSRTPAGFEESRGAQPEPSRQAPGQPAWPQAWMQAEAAPTPAAPQVQQPGPQGRPPPQGYPFGQQGYPPAQQAYPGPPYPPGPSAPPGMQRPPSQGSPGQPVPPPRPGMPGQFPQQPGYPGAPGQPPYPQQPQRTPQRVAPPMRPPSGAGQFNAQGGPEQRFRPELPRPPPGAWQAQQGQGVGERLKLKHRVFKGCDKDCDGFLNQREMLALAVLTGFDGSDAMWAAEYARLCKECNADLNRGIAQQTLFTLLDDQTDAGFFCTDKQLEDFSAALESDSEG